MTTLWRLWREDDKTVGLMVGTKAVWIDLEYVPDIVQALTHYQEHGPILKDSEVYAVGYEEKKP